MRDVVALRDCQVELRSHYNRDGKNEVKIWTSNLIPFGNDELGGGRALGYGTSIYKTDNEVRNQTSNSALNTINYSCGCVHTCESHRVCIYYLAGGAADFPYSR